MVGYRPFGYNPSPWEEKLIDEYGNPLNPIQTSVLELPNFSVPGGQLAGSPMKHGVNADISWWEKLLQAQLGRRL